MPSPAEKTDAVLAILGAPSIDARGVLDVLRRELGTHLVHLTGNPRRDLVRIEVTPDSSSTAARIEGFAGDGTRRLDLVLVFDPDGAVDVALVATKGATVADLYCPIFGQSGPDIGNALLVSRLVDAAVAVLVRGGVTVIRNEPFDERVRAIYARMGFTNGERLELTNRDTLLLLFEDAARIAGLHGHDLCPMPP